MVSAGRHAAAMLALDWVTRLDLEWLSVSKRWSHRKSCGRLSVGRKVRDDTQGHCLVTRQGMNTGRGWSVAAVLDSCTAS